MKIHDVLISNPGQGRIFGRATLGWVGMFSLDHLTLLNAMLLGMSWEKYGIMVMTMVIHSDLMVANSD